MKAGFPEEKDAMEERGRKTSGTRISSVETKCRNTGGEDLLVEKEKEMGGRGRRSLHFTSLTQERC